MTIQELRDVLASLPPDSPVKVEVSYGDGSPAAEYDVRRIELLADGTALIIPEN